MIQSETLRKYVLPALVVFALSPLSVMSLDFPEHIDEIKLRDVMWQDLPQQIYAVFVDRNDRAWYQLCHPAMKEDLSLVCTIIKREFSLPAPQIFGARPALFEPDGRVWFVTHSQTVLLGYDGKDFIEKHADADHFFPGNCPNHGRVYRAGCNLFADGTAFFLESHGVLTFSKGEWSYQQMSGISPAKRNSLCYPSISMEQDGRGVTALMIEGDNTSLWRWRSGKWSKVPLPDTIELKNLTAAVPWQNGVWLFTKAGIVYYAYNSNVSEDFERLLKKLGDESYQVREEGMRGMMKLGASILNRANKAVGESQDPEVSMRLKQVIAALTPAAGQSVTFGPYQLSQAQLAHYDDNATVYVTAADIIDRGKSLGPGLVIGKRDGTFSAVAGAWLPQRWCSVNSEDSGPLVLKSGKQVWLPVYSGGFRPGLLDIDEKKFTVAMPDPRVYWLHALKSDGTVFAGRRESSQSGGRPVMMFKPSARDDRNMLSGEHIEIAGVEKVCVASDGRILAEAVGQGLVRFDGRKWDKIEGAAMQGIRDFLTGDEGAVIITTDSTCALIIGDKVVQRGSVRDLVSSCARDIARLFKSGGSASWLGVAPDDKGNIWLRETRKLSVLVNGRWQDADGALKEAGSRTSGVEYLGVCGDGGRVYVTDFMMVHDKGSSHFGEVKDGQILFSKAPHTCERSFMHLNIHDGGRGLWVPGSVRGGGGTCDWISGQLALRITEKGVVQEFKNAGWAKLKDESGNVWLGEIRGKEENIFSIWRDGEILNTVAVPGAYEGCTLVSDRPGSVFVWTRFGLRHMVAGDSGKPAAYSSGKLYTVENMEDSNEQMIKLSRLGFLAVSAYSNRSGPRKCYLHIIKLPAGNSAD